MAGTPYLVDSNVLLRWVKPDDRDYPLVVSAIDATLQRGAVFCYTSQNVAEFWNTCTRPLDRNGYGLSPQEADRRARLFEDKLRLLPDSLAVHQEWPYKGCQVKKHFPCRNARNIFPAFSPVAIPATSFFSRLTVVACRGAAP